MVGFSERPFPSCRRLTSCILWWRAEKGSKLSQDFYKGIHPIHESLTLIANPDGLSKAPPSTTSCGGRVGLGSRVST